MVMAAEHPRLTHQAPHGVVSTWSLTFWWLRHGVRGAAGADAPGQAPDAREQVSWRSGF